LLTQGFALEHKWSEYSTQEKARARQLAEKRQRELEAQWCDSSAIIDL